MTAAALVGRPLHRGQIVSSRGNSYRMRRRMERWKAFQSTAPRAMDAEDARQSEGSWSAAGAGPKCTFFHGR